MYIFFKSKIEGDQRYMRTCSSEWSRSTSYVLPMLVAAVWCDRVFTPCGACSTSNFRLQSFLGVRLILLEQIANPSSRFPDTELKGRSILGNSCRYV